MKRKIINILIIAVAFVGIFFGLWFALSFNDEKDKKALYKDVNAIKEKSPEMLTDFAAVTVKDLPAFVEKYQPKVQTLNDSLKATKLQKDVLYTFITNLQELSNNRKFDPEKFNAFKSNFTAYDNGLLAKSDKRNEYVTGFNNVTDSASLANFIKKLEAEYAPMKQEYIMQKDYVRAVGSIVGKFQSYEENLSSEKKKETEVTTLVSDIKSSERNSTILDISFDAFYVLFFATILVLAAFATYYLFKNIKTSYKGLLGVVAMIILAIIAYAIASPDLSPVAIKNNATPQTVKLVGAGAITAEVIFILAIVMIIASSIISLIKKSR